MNLESACSWAKLVKGGELILRVVRAVDGQHQLVFIGADGNGKGGAGLLGAQEVESPYHGDQRKTEIR